MATHSEIVRVCNMFLYLIQQLQLGMEPSKIALDFKKFTAMLRRSLLQRAMLLRVLIQNMLIFMFLLLLLRVIRRRSLGAVLARLRA